MIGCRNITYISQVYPPPDTQIRDHLSFINQPTNVVKQRFMIFLRALFFEVTKALAKLDSLNGESIQSAWFRYSNAGETYQGVSSAGTFMTRLLSFANSVDFACYYQLIC